MELRFTNPGLELFFSDDTLAAKEWGTDAARRYSYVVNFLACIDTAKDLSKFAFLDLRDSSEEGRPHPGWTLHLAGRWHLALEVVEGGEALSIMEVYCRE